VKQYQFCTRNKENVAAELVSWTTQQASQCPTSYTALDMVVSKTNPMATTSDLVWRLDPYRTAYDAIHLLTTDADTRLGSCECHALF
jgi:hypothetical protein